MLRRYRNRTEAGFILGKLVTPRVPEPDALVLALPRGGVPVGFEIAVALCAPLDIVLVRKLGVPGQEELAMGAIAGGGVRVLNESLVAQLEVPSAMMDQVTVRERQELERREALYREGKPALAMRGRTAVLTDDGLATGATMLAAIRFVRLQGVRRLLVAVPVGAPQTCAELGSEVDEMICAAMPEGLGAVSAWYEDFSQVNDAEVNDLLTEAVRRFGGAEGQGRNDETDAPKRQLTHPT